MGCTVTKPAPVPATVPTTTADNVTVESVQFFRDNNGEKGEKLTEPFFYVTDIRLHAQAKLSALVPGMDGKVVWICKDCRGRAAPNFEVASATFNSTLVNVIDAHVELPRNWPAGSYELRVYLGDNLLHVEPFDIIDPDHPEDNPTPNAGAAETATNNNSDN
ncbi:hypothetical protein PAPYR_8646 [Paratrimastix pyriformis]|uniref:Lipoprotein n=1 Tax=Paratrimastix pyriformis TaxID=342808 RepID=A0ABQ8UA65_9EUKA|nr:hypothetical protein PAPYR_8646 [Paratrimastix pyriformis]